MSLRLWLWEFYQISFSYVHASRDDGVRSRILCLNPGTYIQSINSITYCTSFRYIPFRDNDAHIFWMQGMASAPPSPARSLYCSQKWRKTRNKMSLLKIHSAHFVAWIDIKIYLYAYVYITACRSRCFPLSLSPSTCGYFMFNKKRQKKNNNHRNKV